METRSFLFALPASWQTASKSFSAGRYAGSSQTAGFLRSASISFLSASWAADCANAIAQTAAAHAPSTKRRVIRGSGP